MRDRRADVRQSWTRSTTPSRRRDRRAVAADHRLRRQRRRSLARRSATRSSAPETACTGGRSSALVCVYGDRFPHRHSVRGVRVCRVGLAVLTAQRAVFVAHLLGHRDERRPRSWPSPPSPPAAPPSTRHACELVSVPTGVRPSFGSARRRTPARAARRSQPCRTCCSDSAAAFRPPARCRIGCPLRNSSARSPRGRARQRAIIRMGRRSPARDSRIPPADYGERHVAEQEPGIVLVAVPHDRRHRARLRGLPPVALGRNRSDRSWATRPARERLARAWLRLRARVRIAEREPVRVPGKPDGRALRSEPIPDHRLGRPAVEHTPCQEATHSGQYGDGGGRFRACPSSEQGKPVAR